MADQFAYIGTHDIGARLAFRIDSLIAINVERNADISEKSSFQELDCRSVKTVRLVWTELLYLSSPLKTSF